MNEDLVRRMVAAFNAHDPAAFASCLAEGGTFTSAYWGIDGRSYAGQDGLAEYFEDMGELYDSFEIELQRVEGKTAICTLHAREHDSDVAVDPTIAFVFAFDEDADDQPARSIVTRADV